MDLKYIERWLQQQDDELVDFVEEKPYDIGDIAASRYVRNLSPDIVIVDDLE